MDEQEKSDALIIRALDELGIISLNVCSMGGHILTTYGWTIVRGLISLGAFYFGARIVLDAWALVPETGSIYQLIISIARLVFDVTFAAMDHSVIFQRVRRILHRLYERSIDTYNEMGNFVTRQLQIGNSK